MSSVAAKKPSQPGGQDVDAPVDQDDGAALGRLEAPDPLGEARIALEQAADHARAALMPRARRTSTGPSMPRAPGWGTRACPGCRCSARAPEIVASLHVEIVPQNRAAVSEVCPEMEQVVVGLAEQRHPERHDLHVAARARAGHGVLAKAAFHLDQPQDELRIEACPQRLVMDRTQQFHAALPLGHARRQALFHLVDPALAVLGRAKVQPGRCLVRHHGGQALAHAVGEGLVVSGFPHVPTGARARPPKQPALS